MTTLRTLENTSAEKILEVFNLSFSDYLIPLCLTKEQFEDKLKSESIRLEFSVGAFEGDELVALILHGYDIVDGLKTLYNAGTGVIPSERGNGLTAKLYEYILPIFCKNDVDKILLQVITTNEVAIKIYKSIGFGIVKELDCLKGSIDIVTTANSFEIKQLDLYDWEVLKSFWDLEPLWQNSITAVEKLINSNASIGAFENGKLLGYAIYNPLIKRIHQVAVHKNHRRRGVGLCLLKHVSTLNAKDISVLNIDHSSVHVLKFMTDIGLKVFIKQYEMELNLKKNLLRA
jgi:ribosomal protein S18 acetylase RimI-like enzyme